MQRQEITQENIPDDVPLSVLERLYSKMQGGSKHSRFVVSGQRFRQVSYTKRNPWTVRAENRTKNRRARAARKINR